MCRYLSAKECGAYESLYNPVGVGMGWLSPPRTALRLSWASKCSPFGAKNLLMEDIDSSYWQVHMTSPFVYAC